MLLISKIIMIIKSYTNLDYYDYQVIQPMLILPSPETEAGRRTKITRRQRSSQRAPARAPKMGSHRVETLSLWPAVSPISSPLSVTALTSQRDGWTQGSTTANSATNQLKIGRGARAGGPVQEVGKRGRRGVVSACRRSFRLPSSSKPLA